MDGDYALYAATSNAEQEERLILCKPLSKCTREERKHRAKLQQHEWMKKNNIVHVSYIGEPVYVNC